MEEMKLIVYVKRDEHGSIIQINSNVFIDELEGWEQVDEWQEGQDRYLYSHAGNGDYVQEKYGKPLYDDLGRPNFKDDFVELTEEEKESLYPVYQETEKEKQEAALQEMMLMSARTSFLNELPDEQALDFKLCYENWELMPEGKECTEGIRYLYKEGLWLCNKTHNKQSNWFPGNDPTLFTQLDKDEHKGTLEDPIPVPDSVTTSGFTYVYGNYYLEGEHKYLCKRGGVPNPEELYGQPVTLYFKPSSVIGQYFEQV